MTTYTFHVAVRQDYNSLSEKLRTLIPLFSLVDDEEGGYRTWYEVEVEASSNDAAGERVNKYLEENESGEVEICHLVKIDEEKTPLSNGLRTKWGPVPMAS